MSHAKSFSKASQASFSSRAFAGRSQTFSSVGFTEQGGFADEMHITFDFCFTFLQIFYFVKGILVIIYFPSFSVVKFEPHIMVFLELRYSRVYY